MAIAAEVAILFKGDTKGLQDAASEAEKATGGLKDKLGGLSSALGTGLAVGAVAGGAAIAGLGKAALDLGATFDDAYDGIALKTGATGAKLDALKGSFKNVVSSVPTDFGTASDVVGTFAQKLGTTGPALDALASKTINLARLTGTDASSAAKNAADSFKLFGVAAKDQGSALDLLLTKSQESGVAVDQLQASMNAGASTFKAAGLDFAQSAALVAGLGKAGVDVGAVMPGLSKALTSAAKEGKTGSVAMHELEARIKGAGSASAAQKIAIEAFGKSGIKMADAIRSGALSIGDLKSGLSGVPDAINKAAAGTDDFGQKFEVMKNKLMVALEPIGNAAMDAMGAVADAFMPLLDKATPIITQLAQQFAAFVGKLTSGGISVGPVVAVISQAFGVLGTALSTIPWPTIISAVGTLAQAFMAGLGVVVPIVATALQTLWGIIGPFVPAIAGVAAAFALLSNPIGIAIVAITAIGAAATLLGPVWDGIVAGLTNLGVNIMTQWTAFTTTITTALTTIGTAITTSWQAFTDTISAALDAIASLIRLQWDAFLRAITDKLDAILGAVTTAWTAVQQAVSDTLDALKAAIDAAWAAMVDTITKALDGIKNVVSTVLDAVAGVFRTELDIAKGIVTATWQAITGDFQGALDTIHALVERVFNGIIDTVRGVLGLLPGAVREPLQGAWDAFAQWGRNLIDEVFRVASDVMDAAKSIGTNIAEGIQGALQGAWDGLVGKLKALVDMLPQAVKDLLGIHSPSTVFAEIGEDIASGLAVGLDRGMTKTREVAVRAMEDLTGSLVGTGKRINFGGIGGPGAGINPGALGGLGAPNVGSLGGIDIFGRFAIAFEQMGTALNAISSAAIRGLVGGSVAPSTITPLARSKKIDIGDLDAMDPRNVGQWVFGLGWRGATPGPKGGPYAKHGVGHGQYSRWAQDNLASLASKATQESGWNMVVEGGKPPLGSGLGDALPAAISGLTGAVADLANAIAASVGGGLISGPGPGISGGGSRGGGGAIGSPAPSPVPTPHPREGTGGNGGAGVDTLAVTIVNVVDEKVISQLTKTSKGQRLNKRYRNMVPGAI